MAALGGAGMLMNNKSSTPAPPPVVMPTAPQGAHDPNAVVKVGDNTTPQQLSAAPTYDGFTATRTFGKPLGGLGRGGLGL